MSHLATDTIGGFNAVLEKQKQEVGTAIITTALFDHNYEILHDAVPIQDVSPLTSKEYFVRGNTALLDAVGLSVQRLENRIQTVPKEEKPDNVMVVITTDGYENASKKYTYATVKELIRQKSEQGWQFIFLGAKFGIQADHAVNFHADSIGVDIHSKSPGVAGLLSNFTMRSFVFDGVLCHSLEGILQSLKFKDPVQQAEICQTLPPSSAKKIGTDQNWKTHQVLYWKGEAYGRESVAYANLIRSIFESAYDQDPSFQKDLSETIGVPLSHSIGVSDAKETVLTRGEFISILTALRDSKEESPLW